ncbi:hypothetical protein ACP275_12G146700 [Erythranthe tilingii]
MQLAQEEVIFIKGKRSKRSIRAASPLALTMAATSSSTTADSSGVAVVISDISGSSDRDSGDHQEEEDMANCLMLLAGGQTQKSPPTPPSTAATAAVEVYQCKTCSKSFSSFQALGGHRASHKRPIKPQTLDHEIKKPPPLKQYRQEMISSSPSNPCADDSSIILSLQITGSGLRSKTTIRVHECSICGAEFASGQALGGHMRRHRPIPTAAATSSNGGHGGGGECQEMKRPRNNLLSLDLNLPAPEDHDHRDSKFPFAPKEQVIVFSTSPMVVDCHY